MKKIKLLCVIIAALVAMSSVTVFAADSFITLDGFTFKKISDTQAVIISYEGNDKDVVIPEKLLEADVVAIDEYALFGNTEITAVSFENAAKLKTIGMDAFYGCSSLKTLSIPSNLVSIGFGAFQDCSGLVSVKIENGLSEIGNQAFLGCTALVDIVIPDSVTQIGSSAFKNCDDLTIYCEPDTAAQSFAEEKGTDFDFVGRCGLGDANRDGIVDINDATYIQMYRLKMIDIKTYAGVQLADVNRDGDVTLRDATVIQLYRVGLVAKF